MLTSNIDPSKLATCLLRTCASHFRSSNPSHPYRMCGAQVKPIAFESLDKLPCLSGRNSPLSIVVEVVEWSGVILGQGSIEVT